MRHALDSGLVAHPRLHRVRSARRRVDLTLGVQEPGFLLRGRAQPALVVDRHLHGGDHVRLRHPSRRGRHRRQTRHLGELVLVGVGHRQRGRRGLFRTPVAARGRGDRRRTPGTQIRERPRRVLAGLQGRLFLAHREPDRFGLGVPRHGEDCRAFPQMGEGSARRPVGGHRRELARRPDDGEREREFHGRSFSS